MIISTQTMPPVPPCIHDFSLLSHTISGPEFQHQTFLGGTHPREHHLPPFSSPKYSLFGFCCKLISLMSVSSMDHAKFF